MEFVLEWENLCVRVIQEHGRFYKKIVEEKTILDNVSGVITSNKLVAIMGPSGSGKTTFLRTISGRINEFSGCVKINGQILTRNEIKNISGYIPQHDVFSEYVTIAEHMKFVAALKLKECEMERNEKIKKVLIDLSLEESRHTIIQRLSGGEKRRLSLATELISNPHILFCDEITTGLDSFSAISVIQTLEALVMTGKLILVTVHQPSSQLFQLFNNLILFSNGRVIFDNSRKEVTNFFESANLICPRNFNQADFYIKCLTIHPWSEEKDKQQIDRLFDLFHKNWKINKDHSLKTFADKLPKEKCYQRNFFVQFRWLCWRNYKNFIRNTANFKITLLFSTITALGIAIMFSDAKLNDASSVQNVAGVFSIMISELVFVHMYYVVYVFPSEVPLFLKEQNLYRTTPYYISKLLISIVPLCLITPTIYVTIYFIVLQFLHGACLFLKMLFELILISAAGVALGLCLSTWCTKLEYFTLISVPFETIIMILSGIWIKIDTLPYVFTLLKYTSPFYYGFEAISVIFWEPLEHLNTCTNVTTVCFKNGKEVLQRYDFLENYDVLLVNTMYLISLTIVYSFFGYLAMLRKRIFNVYS